MKRSQAKSEREDGKRKLNSALREEMPLEKMPKPGLDNPCNHIAELFTARQPELAAELTRALFPHAALRVGVRRATRRWGRRGSR